jgi:hypothetical protein
VGLPRLSITVRAWMSTIAVMIFSSNVGLQDGAACIGDEPWWQ